MTNKSGAISITTPSGSTTPVTVTEDPAPYTPLSDETFCVNSDNPDVLFSPDAVPGGFSVAPQPGGHISCTIHNKAPLDMEPATVQVPDIHVLPPNCHLVSSTGDVGTHELQAGENVFHVTNEHRHVHPAQHHHQKDGESCHRDATA